MVRVTTGKELVAGVVLVLSSLTLSVTESFQIPATQQPLRPATRTATVGRSSISKTAFSAGTPLGGFGSSSSSSSLQASPLLNAVGSPAASLLVLAGIVVVHECGHYLAARSFGIQVEEFSIGFGPKLAGFNAFGNDFNLRAFPLGGYVRFPENYNTTLVQEQQEALEEEKRAAMASSAIDTTAIEEESVPSDSKWGGLMNALTFGAVERAKRKEEEKLRLKEQRLAEEQLLAESEAARNNLPWWKKAFAFKQNNEDVGKQQQQVTPIKNNMDGGDNEIEIEYYDDPTLLQNRPWTERAVVLSGGVIFNLLLAFFIYFGEIGFGSGIPQPQFQPGAVVGSVPRADGASSGILRQGDVILSINGSPLSLSDRPNAFEAQKSISDFIAKIRQTPEGDSLQLSVLRRDETAANAPFDVTVQPKRLVNDYGTYGPQSIGVFLSPNFVQMKVIKTDSVIEAAQLASKSVTELTTETTKGLLSFFSATVSGKADSAAGQQISGPIGLIRTGSEVVSSQDLNTVLLFAAAISINLGVVNALPLPALDGGQLVFVLAEAITGRKIDQRLQEGVTGFTVLLLLLITVSTAFGDVQSILQR